MLASSISRPGNMPLLLHYFHSLFMCLIMTLLQPAAEEVVDMRGGWADPDLFLWFGKVRPKKKKKKVTTN